MYQQEYCQNHCRTFKLATYAGNPKNKNILNNQNSMKQVFAILAAVLITATVWAQSPEKMSYQAVIRNSSNALVANTQVGMQISILQGSASGTAVYVETQIPTTNANGLVSIEIGGGTLVSGDFTSIDWANGPYFIETKTAIVPPLTTYTITGTSQLLSVPYALHAKSADSLTGGITETDPLFSSWSKNYNDLINAPAPWDSSYASIKNTPDLAVYATKNMNNETISNLAEPVNAGDAATKSYVDALLARIEALEAHESLKVIEISDLLKNGFIDKRDLNHYRVVQIGSQIWMAENLRYLPSVAGALSGSSTTPYYYVYGYQDNNVNKAKIEDNYQTYGVLYNWPAAMAGSASSSSNPSGVQGVCPTGWHLPSDAEWTELTDYLGGASLAGYKLKETGISHWNAPNTGANNETGFTALPGGFYDYTSRTFMSIEGGGGYRGVWWSATKEGLSNVWYRDMLNDRGNVRIGYLSPEMGYSVRCVSDEAPSLFPPTLTTDSVVSVTQTTAVSGGNISSDGGDTILDRGVCWSTDRYPSIVDSKTSDGSGSGEFTSSLTGLTCRTTYYLRAYATNSVGTAYGMEVTFTTSEPLPPSLTTNSVESVTLTSAVSGGNISSDGYATVYARGVCWSTEPNPTTADNKTTDGTGIGEFTSTLTNLSPGTTYHLRAYATNAAGTAYGEEVSFATTALENFTDSRDGNVYEYVSIGSQVWMTENLRYLPDIVGPGTGSDTTACYYVYGYDGTNVSEAKATGNYQTYGVLYNWPAAMAGSASSSANPSGVQGVCPAGWHLPSDAEWTVLTNLLGGSSLAGGKLKETGTSHWSSPNTGASNETFFSALPGGYRYTNGTFANIDYYGFWWCATEYATGGTWYLRMQYNNRDLVRDYYYTKLGLSVRCVRD